jgi:predicted metalloprotease
MRARALLIVLLVGSLGAGCVTVDQGVEATDSQQEAQASTPVIDPGDDGVLIEDDAGTEDPGTTNPDEPGSKEFPIIEGVIDFGSSKPPQSYDGFMTAVFGDIQAWWEVTYPQLYGEPYEPLAGGVFAGYESRKEPIPGCGTEESTYSDVFESGAFYCSLGDFMAYDDTSLLPSLVSQLGEAAVGVVMAHEFGHAIQARADNFDQPTILLEQQADCFAGAWSAHVASGGSDIVQFSDADVRGGLIAMVTVRDPVGNENAGPDAHGSGFDRVGAFQDGFLGGPERCKPFFEENRESQLIAIPFTREDFETGGNLPFEEVPEFIPQDLGLFWTSLLNSENSSFTIPEIVAYPQDGPFPECPGVADEAFPENVFYCEANNSIMFDRDFAEQLYSAPLLVETPLGDMSLGYLLSNAFSDAVQLSLSSQLTGEPRQLLNYCLTGVWVGDIVPPVPADREELTGRSLQLSAGDLDEAIITAMLRSDNASDANIRGSAFEQIDAFRSGVLGGLDACSNLLD